MFRGSNTTPNPFTGMGQWGAVTPMYTMPQQSSPLIPSLNAMDELSVNPALDLNMGMRNIGAMNPPGFNMGEFMGNHGKTLLGGALGLGNLFMGMRQYGMAKDALKESRRQFDLNYGAQRNLTNSRLEDRQNARRAAQPGVHETTDEYMRRFGV